MLRHGFHGVGAKYFFSCQRWGKGSVRDILLRLLSVLLVLDQLYLRLAWLQSPSSVERYEEERQVSGKIANYSISLSGGARPFLRF